MTGIYVPHSGSEGLNGLKDVDPGVPSNKGHVTDELTDSFKLLGCILLALLTLSSRIISPGLSSGTKKEITCLW